MESSPYYIKYEAMVEMLSQMINELYKKNNNKISDERVDDVNEPTNK